MSKELKSWARPHFTPNGGTPLLFYAVFGSFDLSKPLSRSKYRTSGMPDWLEMVSYEKTKQPEVIREYQSGKVWEIMSRDTPLTAKEAENTEQCIVLRGELEDPSTLDYFRDMIGIATWLLDVGGVAVYDPQMLWLWSKDEWRAEIFEPNEPYPERHTAILVSEEEDGSVWYHTRGMRKYGRPDLSVNRVGADHADGVTNLIDRFVAFQALGGVIEEGEVVHMKDLPAGGVCHHRGHLEDPDFNNVHVEVTWPEGALS